MNTIQINWKYVVIRRLRTMMHNVIQTCIDNVDIYSENY